MKEFKTECEVENWIFSNYSNTIINMNKIKSNKFKALYSYTGGRNINLNKSLRKIRCNDLQDLFKLLSKDTSNEIEIDDFDTIKSLSELLRKTKICDDIIVYRYTKKRFIKRNFIHRTLLIDYGFMSTTMLPFSKGMISLKKNNNYNILLKLNIPKGTAGVPIFYNGTNSVLKEYEILLDFGLKFKFVKRQFNFKHFIMTYEYELID